MKIYKEYLNEIEERKVQNLNPKPIDGSELLSEVILQIKDLSSPDRKDSLDFFIFLTYSPWPGDIPPLGRLDRSGRGIVALGEA